MENAAETPAFARKTKEDIETRTLEFESDGHPTFKEFSAWNMRIVAAWSPDPTAKVAIVNGNLKFEATAGTKIFFRLLSRF